MLDINVRKQLHGSNGEMYLDIDLRIKQGELVLLMGESGSGKTTLLRVLAGLEKAEGDVSVDGISWHDIPLQKRDIGFVFQDYALFENMSIEENLLFVKNDKALASELLEITALTALKNRNVTGLSGGQKQRVALCRAMMKKPKLLLMDEPLSALDSKLRTKLQKFIKDFHHRFSSTIIMVSHDMRDIFALASRVLVLDLGKVVQDGTVEEVFQESDTEHDAEVLRLEDVDTRILATVYVADKLLKIEVSATVKVGDTIEIRLKGKKV